MSRRPWLLGIKTLGLWLALFTPFADAQSGLQRLCNELKREFLWQADPRLRDWLVPGGGLCASTCVVNVGRLVREALGLKPIYQNSAEEIIALLKRLETRGIDGKVGLTNYQSEIAFQVLFRDMYRTNVPKIETRRTWLGEAIPYEWLSGEDGVNGIVQLDVVSTNDRWHAMLVMKAERNHNTNAIEADLQDPNNPSMTMPAVLKSTRAKGDRANTFELTFTMPGNSHFLNEGPHYIASALRIILPSEGAKPKLDHVAGGTPGNIPQRQILSPDLLNLGMRGLKDWILSYAWNEQNQTLESDKTGTKISLQQWTEALGAIGTWLESLQRQGDGRYLDPATQTTYSSTDFSRLKETHSMAYWEARELQN